MGAYISAVLNLESQLQAMMFYIRDRSAVDRWIDRYSGRWVVYVYVFVYKAVAAAGKKLEVYIVAEVTFESQLHCYVYT